MSRCLLALALLSSAVRCISSAIQRSDPTPQSCNITPATSRSACGYPWDTSLSCSARKGCWDPTQHPMCYYPDHPAVPITRVFVVQGAHLDVGFADTAAGIINRWWYTHFPRAYALGLELTARGGQEQIKFTTQSYLVSLFVDCPPAFLVRCPTAGELTNFTAAVKAGYITWHAYPHSGSVEKHDPSMLAFALKMTHDLDDRFGVRRKSVLSLRDVPGLTRAALPVLAAAGVTAINIGANGDSNPPFVPRAFRWHDGGSGITALGMIHPFGYGGIGSSDAIVIPGCPDALVVAWRGDNSGPPANAAEVESNWADIKSTFGVTNVTVATFEEAMDALLPYMNNLPVITAEIGDTWSNIATGDPVKQSWFKIAQGLRVACISDKTCSEDDPRIYNFSRQLVKNAEHTWSIDASTFLKDWSNYTNAYLDEKLSSGDPAFKKMVDSWIEQRTLGFDFPLQALEDHPLAQRLRDAFASTLPSAEPDPLVEGFTPFNPATEEISAGRFTLAFDAGSGALSRLRDGVTGIEWANSTAGFPLLSPLYTTLSAADFEDLVEQYCYWPGECPLWWQQNHAYYGLNASRPVHQDVTPTLTGAWVKIDTATHTTSFLLRSAFGGPSPPYALQTQYGAPEVVWMRVTAPLNTSADPLSGDNRINATMSIFRKRPTHMPESLFLRFVPAALGGAWLVEKIGSFIDPANVHPGGNQVQHGFCGVRYTSGASGGTLTLSSCDAALVSMGAPRGLPISMWDPPDADQGAAFFLAGNMWNTNSPLWWPYLASEANMTWSAVMRFN